MLISRQGTICGGQRRHHALARSFPAAAAHTDLLVAIASQDAVGSHMAADDAL